MKKSKNPTLLFRQYLAEFSKFVQECMACRRDYFLYFEIILLLLHQILALTKNFNRAKCVIASLNLTFEFRNCLMGIFSSVNSFFTLDNYVGTLLFSLICKHSKIRDSLTGFCLRRRKNCQTPYSGSSARFHEIFFNDCCFQESSKGMVRTHLNWKPKPKIYKYN